jgi:hypothetical protein
MRFSNDLWVSTHPCAGKLAVDENRRGNLFRTGPSSSVGMSRATAASTKPSSGCVNELALAIQRSRAPWRPSRLE